MPSTVPPFAGVLLIFNLSSNNVLSVLSTDTGTLGAPVVLSSPIIPRLVVINVDDHKPF